MRSRRGQFVTHPRTKSSDGRVINVAHGASGSDVMLVSQMKNNYWLVKSVVSDVSSPYRVIPMSRRETCSEIDSYCRWAGDRLEDGKIICAAPDDSLDGREIQTRVIVEEGRGEPRVLAEEVYPGTIGWMRGLMAHKESQSSCLMLFDIGRGKIEVVGSIATFFETTTGVVLANKVALTGGCSGYYINDMRTRSSIHQDLKECPDANVPAIIAGCRVFFSSQKNDGQIIEGEPIKVESLKIGTGNGVYQMSTKMYYHSIETAFAWNPACGPLAIVISDNGYSHYGEYIRLLNIRSHVSFEIPGTQSKIQESSPCSTHYYGPTHICGQPVLTAIARSDSEVSSMIL